MLIGVTGKAGSGKDTFAKYFIENHNFFRYSLADPIKRMIEAGFDLTPDIWDDREKKEKEIDWLSLSPRYLAQTLGTEWGRDWIHPDLWLLLAEQRLAKHPHVIVPDIRFDNEAQWIEKNDGILVEVVGGIAPPVDNAGHSSETGVDRRLITTTIRNTGTIEQLHQVAAYVYSVWSNTTV